MLESYTFKATIILLLYIFFLITLKTYKVICKLLIINLFFKQHYF